MGTVIGLLATIIAFLGLLAALGYGGYLLMLSSVASKRPGATHLATDARKQVPAAAGIGAVALVGLLLTNGGMVADVIGLLLAGGAGFAAATQWQAARRRLASPPH